jgi:hypothetical protein
LLLLLAQLFRDRERINLCGDFLLCRRIRLLAFRRELIRELAHLSHIGLLVVRIGCLKLGRRARAGWGRLPKSGEFPTALVNGRSNLCANRSEFLPDKPPFEAKPIGGAAAKRRQRGSFARLHLRLDSNGKRKVLTMLPHPGR